MDWNKIQADWNKIKADQKKEEEKNLIKSGEEFLKDDYTPSYLPPKDEINR